VGVLSQGLVTALINQLEANPDEVALVLDDYHAIEFTAIHDSLGFPLSHLLPRLHLAIASEPRVIRLLVAARPPTTRVAGAAGAGIGRPRGSAPPAGGQLDDRTVDARCEPVVYGGADATTRLATWEVSSDGGYIRRPAGPFWQR
jgi:hypothetical protein